MSKEKPFSYVTLFFFLCAVGIVVFLTAPAWATGTEVEQEVEVVGGQYSGGNTRAYSVGGGDMDIDDCLATHSILFGLWQGTHINKLCEADRLNRDGKYQAAAEMKCSIRSIRRIYGENCIKAVKISAPPPIELPVIVEEDNWEEEEEAWHEEQEQMQVDYDARIARLEQKANQPRVTREIVQQPFLSDEKRAKLQAVLDER